MYVHGSLMHIIKYNESFLEGDGPSVFGMYLYNYSGG